MLCVGECDGGHLGQVVEVVALVARVSVGGLGKWFYSVLINVASLVVLLARGPSLVLGAFELALLVPFSTAASTYESTCDSVFLVLGEARDKKRKSSKGADDEVDDAKKKGADELSPKAVLTAALKTKRSTKRRRCHARGY